MSVASVGFGGVAILSGAGALVARKPRQEQRYGRFEVTLTNTERRSFGRKAVRPLPAARRPERTLALFQQRDVQLICHRPSPTARPLELERATPHGHNHGSLSLHRYLAVPGSLGDEALVLAEVRSKSTMAPSDPDRELERQRSSAISQIGIADNTPEPFLDTLVRIAKATFAADISVVSVVCDGAILIKARVGTELQRLSRDFGFCDSTIRKDQVLWVEDARLDPRFATNSLVAAGIRFYAGAPIVLNSGLRLGAVCLLDVQSQPFQPRIEVSLKALARSAACEIDSRITLPPSIACAMPKDGEDASLDEFVRNAPAKVIKTDRSLRIQQASTAWCVSRGRTPEQVHGRSMYELVSNSAAHWKPIYDKALKGEHQFGTFRSERGGRVEQTPWEAAPWFHRGDVGGLLLVTSVPDKNSDGSLFNG